MIIIIHSLFLLFILTNYFQRVHTFFNNQDICKKESTLNTR